MAGTSPAVDVDRLVVRRGGREILHEVSFASPRGSITGLLGPSGSGKTTLIRALVGVQAIASGRVTVLGRPAGHPALRREVGYVTQAPSIYADLTVEQNARYFAALHGLGRAEARSALDRVGLADLARQRVADLSGGQSSRASLACALVGRPTLLVLDEPTVGLDPVLRRDLWAQFRELARTGTTLVVSSHVMDEAAHCDGLVLLRQGLVVAEDSPDGLRRTTGTDDLDEAFLRLVTAGGPAPAREELR